MESINEQKYLYLIIQNKCNDVYNHVGYKTVFNEVVAESAQCSSQRLGSMRDPQYTDVTKSQLAPSYHLATRICLSLLYIDDRSNLPYSVFGLKWMFNYAIANKTEISA